MWELCIRPLYGFIHANNGSIQRGGTYMKNVSRTDGIRFLAFTLLMVLPATAAAPERPPIAEQMAKTFGIESWDKIDAIRYTANFNFPGVTLSRSWEWEPKSGRVSYEGKDKDGKPVKASYLQSELSTQSDTIKNDVQPGFVNDQYWLIVPFHVIWDTSATVTNEGKQKLPLGKGTAEKILVKYPAEAGGYTPGDTWEFFVGADKRVAEMAYHRGGPKKPSVVLVRWSGYKKAGPLLVATDHRGTADGKPLKMTFTNVAVKVAGSDKWVPAQ
jgi:hypothetical protein